MGRFPLIAFLFLAASASLMAGPWTRPKEKTSSDVAAKPSPWADDRSFGPYAIHSEFPLHDVQDLMQDLADLQDDLEKTLKLQCQPQAIQIYLFSSKRTYDQYIRIRIPEGVNRRALYVPGTDAGRVYAFRNRELEIDVRHETTHALLHTALPYVPIWIDEGLAEYFEIPDGQRVKGHVHRTELRNAITWNHWRPNIEKLESKRKLMDMNGQDYRDSWGIVHFILNGPPEAREALSLYFEQIQSGAPPTPLSQLLRKRIANLDQAIVDHLQK
jgi:hypothetical protein